MIQIPPKELVPVALGAFRGAIETDGTMLETQRETINAIATMFGGTRVDVSDATALEPDAVAMQVSDPAFRQQLIQAMVVMAFFEHPPSRERSARIDAYAKALDVDEKSVRVIHDYAENHMKRMVIDSYRETAVIEWEKAFIKEEGLSTVVKNMLGTFHKGEAPELAAKFTALEHCPPGSLGRKFWEMYSSRKWPFPGQDGGVPEAITVHDWVHILSGYEPNMIGEIQVNAFMAAGSSKPTGFSTMVLALGLYEAGAFKIPNIPQSEGHVMEEPNAPAALADAIRRGIATNEDLLEGIDHWALKDESVVELRKRFHIIEKDEPTPTVDVGL